jgi:hypothetical protein
MGAAKARGDIGCSTNENRWPASMPSIMKRTPMLPKNLAIPSRGPTTFACVDRIVSMAISIECREPGCRKLDHRGQYS